MIPKIIFITASVIGLLFVAFDEAHRDQQSKIINLISEGEYEDAVDLASVWVIETKGYPEDHKKALLMYDVAKRAKAKNEAKEKKAKGENHE